MFAINSITVGTASVLVTLLVVGFTVLIKLNKIEDEENRKKEKQIELLYKITFPCRKCGQMVTPSHIKEDRWFYKCRCKNSWFLNI